MGSLFYLSEALDGGFGVVLSIFVAGLADPLARVVALDVRDVHEDEPKVGDRLEARRVAERFPVVEPLDLEVGVADGDQGALEVRGLTVLQALQALTKDNNSVSLVTHHQL